MGRKIVAKEDFLWYHAGQVLNEKEYQDNWADFVTITEDEPVVIEAPKVIKSIIEGDLDNDGEAYTKKDAKIASKVLNEVKKKKGRPKGKR